MDHKGSGGVTYSGETQGPILVNGNTRQEQIMVGIRQTILVAAGAASILGYAHLAGWLSQWLQLAAPAAGAITFWAGQIKTVKVAKQAVVMANALPDAVATVVK
jgi:hypothetical protein